MQKVFISREWPSNYHELLQDRGVEASVWPEYDVPTHAEFCDASRGAAAIVSTIEDPIDGAVMDAAGRGLRIIAQAGVGFDNIDIEAARQRKVWVTNAPGVLDECTADLAFALLMAVARRLPEAVDYVREDKWSGWHPSLLAGAELHGATIGVVGLGRIGAAFARRCEGFGMRILYTARSAKPEAEARGQVFSAAADRYDGTTRKRAPSSFARREGAEVVVNGGFFGRAGEHCVEGESPHCDRVGGLRSPVKGLVEQAGGSRFGSFLCSFGLPQ